MTNGIIGRDKKYVHCPQCGRFLMKANGRTEIETKCERCNSDIVVEVKDGVVSISGDIKKKL